MVWLSCTVEKICDFLAGITLLRLTILAITPPTVSIPRDTGFTSINRTPESKIRHLPE